MPVYLVRHAKAGNRHDWDGPDRLRPLSRKGRAQADGMARLLGDEPITRVLSSPFVRCVQTVEPLAARSGLAVEEESALAEGASTTRGLKLLRQVAGGHVVLCSHGDVIPALLDALAFRDGLELPDEFDYPKGSTWVLEANRDRFIAAQYLPPPD